jgi:hypothetical protein
VWRSVRSRCSMNSRVRFRTAMSTCNTHCMSDGPARTHDLRVRNRRCHTCTSCSERAAALVDHLCAGFESASQRIPQPPTSYRPNGESL